MAYGVSNKEVARSTADAPNVRPNRMGAMSKRARILLWLLVAVTLAWGVPMLWMNSAGQSLEAFILYFFGGLPTNSPLPARYHPSPTKDRPRTSRPSSAIRWS
jgi:hypothetical protein